MPKGVPEAFRNLRFGQMTWVTGEKDQPLLQFVMPSAEELDLLQNTQAVSEASRLLRSLATAPTEELRNELERQMTVLHQNAMRTHPNTRRAYSYFFTEGTLPSGEKRQRMNDNVIWFCDYAADCLRNVTQSEIQLCVQQADRWFVVSKITGATSNQVLHCIHYVPPIVIEDKDDNGNTNFTSVTSHLIMPFQADGPSPESLKQAP